MTNASRGDVISSSTSKSFLQRNGGDEVDRSGRVLGSRSGARTTTRVITTMGTASRKSTTAGPMGGALSVHLANLP